MVIVGYPVLIMVVEVDANDQGEQVKWWVRGEGEDVNPNPRSATESSKLGSSYI